MSEHRSALITANDVEEAFCIIPVTKSLGRELTQVFPAHANKILYLGEDIRDPWHASVQVYKNCADGTNEMLDVLLRTIISLDEK